MSSTSIRLIIHPPQSAAMNMAVDEALLRLIPDSPAPILRFYQWQDPLTVSIGYFQPRSEVPKGKHPVRRYTGGGLVDHACDFTYSMIFPRNHHLYEIGTSESYCLIHKAITQALTSIGVASDTSPEALPSSASINACFQKPVKHDILIQGSTQKIAGAAQRRTRHACLHQGSIQLIEFERSAMEKSLISHLTPLLGEKIEKSSLTPDEILKANELEASRYSTSEWTDSR